MVGVLSYPSISILQQDCLKGQTVNMETTEYLSVDLS